MIRYKYECWKCSEWHEGMADNRRELKAIAESMGVRVIADRPDRKPRIANNGRLWLLPLPFGYGIALGVTGGAWFGKWRTARWEFADHVHPLDTARDWAHEVLGTPRV